MLKSLPTLTFWEFLKYLFSFSLLELQFKNFFKKSLERKMNKRKLVSDKQ